MCGLLTLTKPTIFLHFFQDTSSRGSKYKDFYSSVSINKDLIIEIVKSLGLYLIFVSYTSYPLNVSFEWRLINSRSTYIKVTCQFISSRPL